MKTIRASWYEVWLKKSYGAKLPGPHHNQREAKTAIKKAIEKQKEAGYKPDEFFIMIADCIRTYDENGDTISETTTYARV